jgi:sugar lactone lactonase YvrE
MILLVFAAIGCDANRCKRDTLLVTITLADRAAPADRLRVIIRVDGQGERTSEVPAPTSTTGTLEVGFSRYPVGRAVTVTIEAIRDGAPVAIGSNTATLNSGCDVLTVDVVNDSPAGDAAATSDGGSLDLLSTTDAAILTNLALLSGIPGGPGNVDGPLPLARFANPVGIAWDSGNRILVADTGNHAIRAIDLSSGQVSTFAGRPGVRGTADGDAMTARFTSPEGLAIAGSTLFVADRGNHAIRKVDLTTGSVTTLAGVAGVSGAMDGSANTARFNSPTGIVVVGSTLYVCDTQNHTIRAVDVNTGDTSTVAGSAGSIGSTDGSPLSARFAAPMGITADSTGVLFVADTGNHTIRRIQLGVSPDVSTYAGAAGMSGYVDGTGGASRFASPTSVVMSSFGGIYVTDTGNNRIRRVKSGGAVSTVAGAGSSGAADGVGAAAQFAAPAGVVVFARGANPFLAVTDRGNSTIRQIGSDLITANAGAVSTLAGSTTRTGSVDGTADAARFDSIGGVVSARVGELVIADRNNNTIRTIDLTNGTTSTLAGLAGVSGSSDGVGGDARFNKPEGLAYDGSGAVYVSDRGNHTIRRIELSTREVSTVAGMAGANASVDGVGGFARFNSPCGLALDAIGHLYVADRDNHTIRRVVLSSKEVSTLAGVPGMSGNLDGTGAAARFAFPLDVESDATGNLIVADTGNHTLRLVTPTGGVSTFAGFAGQVGSVDGIGSGARFYSPVAIAFDPWSASVVVADRDNHTIRRVSTAGAVVSTIVGVPGKIGSQPGPLPASLSLPTGIAVLPSGQIAIGTAENAVLIVR